MNNKIGPASKKHADFLQSDAKIILYGGAAGGGKSYNGLMRHLRFVDDPKYIGYVIRKNSSTLMKSGGLFYEAVDLYKAYEPRVRVKFKEQKIIFPSGAEIAFSHYENDTAGKELYRGLQISGIMYDEASQATADQIFWLLSRNRSKSRYDGGIWLTMNPDPDCYAFEWIQWYLYPKGHPLEGRPDPEKDGKIRWMLRRGNDIAWADTAQELIDMYGSAARPVEFQAIFANIYDNPPLIEGNPDYLANLESLPRIEKERMLYGNWLAREEAAGYWKREWVEEISIAPPDHMFSKTVRAYDLAGTLKSESNPDPDYCVGWKMGKLKTTGEYIILDVVKFRARFHGVMEQILKIAAADGTGVDISIPSDPNSSGKAAATMMLKEIIENGYYARARPTNKAKLERFKPFSAACEAGLVKIVKGCGNDLENNMFNDNRFVYNELEKFDGVSRKYHDDIADAAGDAFMVLATRTKIPSFSPPDFSSVNPFAF